MRRWRPEEDGPAIIPTDDAMEAARFLCGLGEEERCEYVVSLCEELGVPERCNYDVGKSDSCLSVLVMYVHSGPVVFERMMRSPSGGMRVFREALGEYRMIVGRDVPGRPVHLHRGGSCRPRHAGVGPRARF